MKAAIISKPGDISVQEMEMPKITSPTQVLVRVKLTGICGSDVHIYKGENPFATYPVYSAMNLPARSSKSAPESQR